MEFPLRCEHCGDVIGVYEPMLIVEDGEVRETSRLREQAADCEPASVEGCFHELCFELAYEEAHRPHLHRSRRSRESSGRDVRRGAGRNTAGGRGVGALHRGPDGRRPADHMPV